MKNFLRYFNIFIVMVSATAFSPQAFSADTDAMFDSASGAVNIPKAIIDANTCFTDVSLQLVQGLTFIISGGTESICDDDTSGYTTYDPSAGLIRIPFIIVDGGACFSVEMMQNGVEFTVSMVTQKNCNDTPTATPWTGEWSLDSINGAKIANLGITSFVYSATETTWSFILLAQGVSCEAAGTWSVDITGDNGSVSSVTTSQQGCMIEFAQNDIGTIEFSDGGDTMTITITSGNQGTSVYKKIS